MAISSIFLRGNPVSDMYKWVSSFIRIHTLKLSFFLQVKNWVKELKKMLGNDICLCIAGNKIDLEKERHVSVEEAEA